MFILDLDRHHYLHSTKAELLRFLERRADLAELLTAQEASMDAFLSVSAAARYQRQLEEYAQSLLAQQCTKPEWCVLALDGGVPAARAALWTLPGERFRPISS